MSSFGNQFKGIAPWQQKHWDIRAAANFIGGGTGTGFLLLGAITAYLGANVLWLALVGLGLVGAGLFFVWLEIGRPWRSFNVFFNPGTSWMTREGMVAMPLFLSGLGAAWLNDVPTFLVTAFLGMVFLFCQAQILLAAKGIPAWRHGLILPLIILSGLTEGSGLFLVLGPFITGALPGFVPPLFLMLLALRWFVFRRYVASLAKGGAPLKAVKELKKFSGLFFIFGHLMPTVFLALGFMLMSNPVLVAFLFGLAGLMAMFAGWGFKVVLINKVAFNQGFAIPLSPTRGKNQAGPGLAPGWGEKA